MKVTIKGNIDQVKTVLSKSTIPANRKARRGESLIARRNRTIRDQNQILNQAFKIVRNDPNQKELAAALLAALTGRAERMPAILKRAQETITALASPAKEG